MLNEILTSVKAQLYERAVSPLIGSITLYWSIWNYKFVLLILSSDSITKKYKIIDEVLYSTWQQTYLQGALYPTITALVYLYAYPYPSKYVFEFTRKKQKEIIDIKREIEEETLLTEKASRKIRQEINDLEENIQKNLERKNTEIERLNKVIEKLEINNNTVSNNQPQKSKTILNKPLAENQIQLLKLIGKNPEKIYEKNIYQESDGKHIEQKFNLGELEKNDYIKSNYNSIASDNAYTLTHKGRSYLVKNKLI